MSDLIRRGLSVVDQDGVDWLVITDPDPVTGEFVCLSEECGRGRGNINIVVVKDAEAV